MDNEPRLMIDTIVQAARDAGRKILDLRAAPRERVVKGVIDYSTEADIAAQEEIVRSLAQAYPGVTIVAEEQKPPRISGHEFFVVDPLDGTYIYDTGCLEYGVSIAYVRGGRPECSTVYQPARDVLFASTRERGCTRIGNHHRESVQLHHRRPLRQTIIGVDMGSERNRRRKIDRVFSPLAEAVQYERMLGTAVGSIAALLEGNIGAYVCLDAKIWDLAAGALAIEEAGGAVSAPDGSPLHWDRITMSAVFAARPDLLKELIPLTASWVDTL